MQEIHDATIIRKYLNHYDFTKYFTQIPEVFFSANMKKENSSLPFIPPQIIFNFLWMASFGSTL